MRPIDFPKPKFKVGDRVEHTAFAGAIGTITAIQPTPWLPQSPFSYIATWEPSTFPMPARFGLGIVDLDAAHHPEQMLRAAQ
jgi:hypothetical protein